MFWVFAVTMFVLLAPKVFGYLAENSRCGGRTLQVSEIVKR